jgi:hypothetical protein
MGNMTGVEDGFVKSMRVVLQECLESQWYLLGKKFIAHASVTENMTNTDKGVIALVHGEKGSGISIVKMDSRAMAIIIEGLKNSIQKYENLTDKDDVEKLEKIRELNESIRYCREASLRE